jgi:Zn-dependent M16 (insulinase) family peptidase
MIKAIDSDYENLADELSQALTDVSKKIYTRVRLTAFHTGERRDEFMRSLIDAFASGEDFRRGTKIKPFGKKTEGVLIPSGVSYATLVANSTEDGSPAHGSLAVARSILSYGFLWGEIRVKGGAYGAGFVRRKNGTAGFYTYRDPDAKRSVETFAKSGDFLRAFAESGEDYTGFIIGAIGDSDPLVTPKVLAALTLASYISGETYEDKKARRLEMLCTSKEDLIKCADTVDRLVECGGAVVLGGKEKLDAFGDAFDRVIEI